MAEKQRANLPRMSGPAVYRIRVAGKVSARWAERLSGMHIKESEGADGQNETVLEGRLPDQAALAGVLNILYELHLPLSSVECLEGD